MNLTKLMELFGNPDTIHTLSFGDKCTASLITTLMGMGITFTALVILLFIIDGMRKVLISPAVKGGTSVVPKSSAASAVLSAQAGDDQEEEIAAVMAAVFLAVEPGHNEVVIKNIRRVKDFHPRWSQEGLREQLGNRI